MKMLAMTYQKAEQLRDALTIAREALVDSIGESDLTKQLAEHEAFLTAAMHPKGVAMVVER